ncbi:MAG: TRIC cation channel family protein [Cyanobacteria bacterium P01_B01_bin.77]
MFCTLFLYTLDLFSTAVFAASGALVAREQHRNSLTAVSYAILTAVGGGTLRDIFTGGSVYYVLASLEVSKVVAIGGEIATVLFTLSCINKAIKPFF